MPMYGLWGLLDMCNAKRNNPSYKYVPIQEPRIANLLLKLELHHFGHVLLFNPALCLLSVDIYDGYDYSRQISIVESCRLRRFGQLPYAFDSGACNNFKNKFGKDEALLCFGYPNKSACLK